MCAASAGADPTKLIEDLAKRKKVRALGVSMGQGQEVIARRLLAAAVAEGQWLLLQNTHLSLAYLAEVGGGAALPAGDPCMFCSATPVEGAESTGEAC